MMKLIVLNHFKRLFCHHKYKFIRNIYGDEININNGKRSLWECTKCQKYKTREKLYVMPTLYTREQKV